VNDPQLADPADVLLGTLTAEYETTFDATTDAVKLNRLRMPMPNGPVPLANPIAEMTSSSKLAPVQFLKICEPDISKERIYDYNGTTAHLDFTTTPDAVEYQVWLSAYPDGRGAVMQGAVPNYANLVFGLARGKKLYLWLTYTTKDGATSKPSNCLDYTAPLTWKHSP